MMDANGAQRDEENECPVCGCMPADTYRIVRRELNNPFAPAWASAFEKCPECAR